MCLFASEMEQREPFRAVTEEEYAKIYVTFKRRTDQEIIVSDKIIKKLLQNYENESIDMMSIGAGIGWLENCIIKHPCMKITSILAIEPNPDHLPKLREQSNAWTDTVVQIDSSYFNAHYETSQKFDIVLMVHSIYFIDDPLEAIIRAKSFLKHGGQLIIIVQGDQGGKELACHLYARADGAQNILSRNWIDTKFVVDGLKQNNIKYEVENVKISHDVTDFMEKSDSADSSDTVSFFLQTDYKDLDNQLQDEIYQLVKKHVTTTEDNRHIFNHQNGIIIVDNI